MQHTSWNGKLTREFQRRNPQLRNFYTRYADRRNKTGLEICVNKENYLEIYNIHGRLLRIEPKYNHVTGDEVSARSVYNKEIARPYQKALKDMRKMGNPRLKVK